MMVFCIDDTGKPSTIPDNKWIKQGRFYEISDIAEDMEGTLMYILDEPKLDGCEPYIGFIASRFIYIDPQMDFDADIAVNSLLIEALNSR